MSKISSTYCLDAWHNLYIEPVNHDQIRIAACCQSQMNLETSHTFDFVHNDFLGEIRRDLSSGIQSPECDSCWRIEAAGGRSRRHSVMEEYDQPDCQVDLQSLDINVTWACNLACVMCGPTWSSTWAKELSLPATRLIDLGRSHQRSNDWLDRMDFSRISRVHFNGGEPLLNHDHRRD